MLSSSLFELFSLCLVFLTRTSNLTIQYKSNTNITIVLIMARVVRWLCMYYQVLSCVTANQECVNDIAASETMAYLLLLLQSLPQCKFHSAVVSSVRLVSFAVHVTSELLCSPHSIA